MPQLLASPAKLLTRPSPQQLIPAVATAMPCQLWWLAPRGAFLLARGSGASCAPEAATVQAAHQSASRVTHTTQQQGLVLHPQMHVLAAHLAAAAEQTAQVVCVGHACKAHTQVVQHCQPLAARALTFGLPSRMQPQAWSTAVSLCVMRTSKRRCCVVLRSLGLILQRGCLMTGYHTPTCAATSFGQG